MESEYWNRLYYTIKIISSQLLCKKHSKGKGVCPCISAEHCENELELAPDDILADGLLKTGVKEHNQLEVAIGDGMEFTIHGDLKNKGKKNKQLMNHSKVSICIG